MPRKSPRWPERRDQLTQSCPDRSTREASPAPALSRKYSAVSVRTRRQVASAQGTSSVHSIVPCPPASADGSAPPADGLAAVPPPPLLPVPPLGWPPSAADTAPLPVVEAPPASSPAVGAPPAPPPLATGAMGRPPVARPPPVPSETPSSLFGSLPHAALVANARSAVCETRRMPLLAANRSMQRPERRSGEPACGFVSLRSKARRRMVTSGGGSPGVS